MTENIVTILGVLLGSGGIVTAIVVHFLDIRKFNNEVKSGRIDLDIKSDDFWKKRYDILNKELQDKDTWWKERYDSLYGQLQNERNLSNDIVKTLRQELSEIKKDYEEQHTRDEEKYNVLVKQYEQFKQETAERNKVQMERINQLELLVDSYEQKINDKTD